MLKCLLFAKHGRERMGEDRHLDDKGQQEVYMRFLKKKGKWWKNEKKSN